MNEIFFFSQHSLTPLHWASFTDRASACKLLCALDGVDANAVNDDGDSALDDALRNNSFESVRALLELNVDTSNSVVNDSTVEIVQLLEEHRKRSV